MLLAAEVQAEILTLYFSEKRSIRSIARQMGVDRKTVKRLVRRRKVEMTPKIGCRRSILEPYKGGIRDYLLKDPKITATAILNYLREQGYTGGISVVKDFVLYERGRLYRPREAFLRLEFAPGEAAQVDWGEFGNVFGDGVKIHCFAMVLCHSRYMYLEFTRSEKFEEFIRCHENAFKFFGGVPRECWYDNLTSAVQDRVGPLIRFNARFMSYMGHHGIRPQACNVARGNEKGRVEGLIKYIRMNFWSGRVFGDFEELTKQGIVWRNQVANQREHRSTRRVVKLFFESAEKAALMPMNSTPYDTDEVFSRSVGPDFHVQYETNRYSVPWTLVGMAVTVRVNHQSVKIYYNEKFITTHPRSYLKNHVFTVEGHKAGLLERKPGAARETWQISYVKGLGPKMGEYVELVRQGPRSLKHELSKLVALATVYGADAVHEACAECLAGGIIGVDAVELYLKRRHHPARADLKPELIQFTNERLNRVVPAVDLRRYDALLFGCSDPVSASEGECNGNHKQRSGHDARGPEAEVLGSVSDRGHEDDARAREANHPREFAQMGAKGTCGTKDPDDPNQNPGGKVPQTSNGGEF